MPARDARIPGLTESNLMEPSQTWTKREILFLHLKEAANFVAMLDLKTIALATAGTVGTALLIYPLAFIFQVRVVHNVVQLLVMGEQSDHVETPAGETA